MSSSNLSWQEQLRNKRLQNSARTISTSVANNAVGNHGLSSPLNSESSEDVLRQPAASQTTTQKTAFMRWMNVKLESVPDFKPMTSIEKDLRDGKRLVALMEVVGKEPLRPERGNTRIHQMANVAKARAVVEKKMNEPLRSIGNEDIVDGNVKRTLGLIWNIIYYFQVQDIANTMGEQYPALIEDMNNMIIIYYGFFS
ncbi:calponin homology domain-containing protein [Mortierella sp. GBAus27b]|nr:calponin homology domain-containing protein [Mortierella sp. GBAus27b]